MAGESSKTLEHFHLCRRIAMPRTRCAPLPLLWGGVRGGGPLADNRTTPTPALRADPPHKGEGSTEFAAREAWVPIRLQKAIRHIARPMTPVRAPKRADNRIDSPAPADRMAFRLETGAAAWSTTRTGARRPRRGAAPYRNSDRDTACWRSCTPAPRLARGRKHPTRLG